MVFWEKGRSKKPLPPRWQPGNVEREVLTNLHADMGVSATDIRAGEREVRNLDTLISDLLSATTPADRERVLRREGFHVRPHVEQTNPYDRHMDVIVYERPRGSLPPDQLRIPMENGQPSYYRAELRSVVRDDGRSRLDKVVEPMHNEVRWTRAHIGSGGLSRNEIAFQEARFRFGVDSHRKQGLVYSRRDVVLDDQVDARQRTRAVKQTTYDAVYNPLGEVSRGRQAMVYDLTGPNSHVPSRALSHTERPEGGRRMVESTGVHAADPGMPPIYALQCEWSEGAGGQRVLERVSDSRSMPGIYYRRSGVSWSEAVSNAVTFRASRLESQYTPSADMESYLTSL